MCRSLQKKYLKERKMATSPLQSTILIYCCIICGFNLLLRSRTSVFLGGSNIGSSDHLSFLNVTVVVTFARSSSCVAVYRLVVKTFSKAAAEGLRLIKRQLRSILTYRKFVISSLRTAFASGKLSLMLAVPKLDQNWISRFV